MTPDLGATALGLTATYAFWLWLKEPNWYRALVAGLALGLAELTKGTWIVLFVLWPTLWALWNWLKCRQYQTILSRSVCLKQLAQLSCILLLGLYLLNLGYGFEGSFHKLGDYGFRSKTLTGLDDNAAMPTNGGNRFRASVLGSLPVPLPAMDFPTNGGHQVKGVQSPWEVHYGEKAAYLHS
jgi:hypothetical protein